MPRRRGDDSELDYSSLRRSTVQSRDPRRVLVIESSRVDRLLVRAALILKGHAETKVSEVTDLDLGLSLLLQRSYDLVLLGEAASVPSSWEITRAIRGVAPMTPIIWHGQYLEESPENGHGLDQLIEAVEAALATTQPAVAVTPSFASVSWTAASAAS